VRAIATDVYVAWSVCLSACVLGMLASCRKRLNRSRCAWDEDLRRPKKPCIWRGCTLTRRHPANTTEWSVLFGGGDAGCRYYYCSSLFLFFKEKCNCQRTPISADSANRAWHSRSERRSYTNLPLSQTTPAPHRSAWRHKFLFRDGGRRVATGRICSTLCCELRETSRQVGLSLTSCRDSV